MSGPLKFGLKVDPVSKRKVDAMYRNAREAANDRDIPKRVVDTVAEDMRKLAPRGSSSSRSVDVRSSIRRDKDKKRNEVTELIRFTTNAARRKALAVSFGTRRHGVIIPFLQRSRDPGKMFKDYRTRFHRKLESRR